MENSNQPITPILDMNANLSNLIGLTKREYFAGLAMQGLISNNNPNKNQRNIAELAISYSNALLEELDYNENN